MGILSAGFHPMDFRMGGTVSAIKGPVSPASISLYQLVSLIADKPKSGH